jgi:hypothetical protein
MTKRPSREWEDLSPATRDSYRREAKAALGGKKRELAKDPFSLRPGPEREYALKRSAECADNTGRVWRELAEEAIKREGELQRLVACALDEDQGGYRFAPSLEKEMRAALAENGDDSNV